MSVELLLPQQYMRALKHAVWLYRSSRTVRKGSFLVGGCALSTYEGRVAWVKRHFGFGPSSWPMPKTIVFFCVQLSRCSLHWLSERLETFLDLFGKSEVGCHLRCTVDA